jgi:hypothetical protein
MTWKIGRFLLDDRVKLFYTVSAYKSNSDKKCQKETNEKKTLFQENA